MNTNREKILYDIGFKTVKNMVYYYRKDKYKFHSID